jgi:hypothetical protein
LILARVSAITENFTIRQGIIGTIQPTCIYVACATSKIQRRYGIVKAICENLPR